MQNSSIGDIGPNQSVPSNANQIDQPLVASSTPTGLSVESNLETHPENIDQGTADSGVCGLSSFVQTVANWFVWIITFGFCDLFSAPQNSRNPNQQDPIPPNQVQSLQDNQAPSSVAAVTVPSIPLTKDTAVLRLIGFLRAQGLNQLHTYKVFLKHGSENDWRELFNALQADSMLPLDADADLQIVGAALLYTLFKREPRLITDWSFVNLVDCMQKVSQDATSVPTSDLKRVLTIMKQEERLLFKQMVYLFADIAAKHSDPAAYIHQLIDTNARALMLPIHVNQLTDREFSGIGAPHVSQRVAEARDEELKMHEKHAKIGLEIIIARRDELFT